MKCYEVLIFDWDGTIIDSRQQIVNCMQATIAEHQLAAHSDTEVAHIIGLGLNEAIQQLYPLLEASDVHVVAQSYREQFLFRDKTPSPLFDRVEDTLQQLKQRGYELAVATGKSRRGLDKTMRETGLEKYFPISRCADETRSKPDPQMLEEILVDYNTTADKALMVGDTEYDLEMANYIGMDALAVSYGVHSLIRLLKLHPEGFIDHFWQIPDWLERVS